jgi:PilZ domain
MPSLQQGATASAPPLHGERRCRYRRPFHSLAYVKLGTENGGILRDISDRGAALQAVAPLEPGQILHLHFDLLGPNTTGARRRMDVEARVAWCSASGQAGVQFQNMGDPARRQLNEWIFAGILASIAQVAPVLNSADPLEDENLRLAPAGRAPIALPIPLTTSAVRKAAIENDEDLLLDWLLDRISPRTLSLTVDALVLSVAALLFLVVALAVTKTLPGWAAAFGFALCVFAFCGVLYRWMCRFLGMQTAGQWIAEHAIQVRHADHHGWETVIRFR